MPRSKLQYECKVWSLITYTPKKKNTYYFLDKYYVMLKFFHALANKIFTNHYQELLNEVLYEGALELQKVNFSF